MAKSAENQPRVSRTSVGLIALVCLTASAGLWVADWPEAHWHLWQGAFGKVGLVMTAFWLGMPTATRPAAWQNMTWKGWLALAVGAAMVFGLRLRFVLPLFAILFVAAVVLRPRGKRRPPREFRNSGSRGSTGSAEPADLSARR